MTNIYFESILMAFDSIFSNKMRSLLTMLGIIIGVAAVIALMSLGYGVRADIENNIASLGYYYSGNVKKARGQTCSRFYAKFDL